MDNTEAPVTEKKPQKTTFSLKSLLGKLIVIGIVGGSAYWLYLNPNVWQNWLSHFSQKKEQNEVLITQINQLQNQVSALQSQLYNLSEPDMSGFEDKVAKLEKQTLNVIESKADAAIALGLLVRIDKLENRLDKLSKISDDGALILSSAMLVKQAAEEGNEFIYEAEVLNQLAQGVKPIQNDVAVITEYAREGVLSEAELERRFIEINSVQETLGEQAKDWKERLNHKLNEYIKINKTGETSPKNQSRKITEEALMLIDEGKLIKAVKLIESSDSDAIKQNQMMQDWLVSARHVIAFRQAIRNIAAYSLAEMKVKNLKNKD